MATKSFTDEELQAAISVVGTDKQKLADHLGVSLRTVQRRWTGGHEPLIDAPIVRQSTYTRSDGQTGGQWNIRVRPAVMEARAALEEALRTPLAPLPPAPQFQGHHRASLVNEIVFTDYHVGAMADESTQEGLKDQYDLLCGAFEHLISQSIPAKTCIINILGDWFHFDNLLPLTPRSHNVLFANGNYRDLVEMGVKLMRKLIDWALRKYEFVKVVICEGNHDQASALWLRVMMMALYEHEPRIEFADSDTPFYAISHGASFLGYHHGHIKGLKDPKDLALYFSQAYRITWGATEHTYLKTGHLHHVHQKEVHGILVTQEPTLASKDHHAHHHGYWSAEAAWSRTYHDKWGEVAGNRVTKQMLLE